MRGITLVGCGSLGSCIAIETARRCAALEMPLAVTLIDDDTVEERNIVAQEFTPIDLGKSKAEVVFGRVNEFKEIRDGEHVVIRVNSENVTNLILKHPDNPLNHVIIDAVDNIPTRQLLWQHGMAQGIPVLQAAMNKQGGGYVSWSYAEVDTFPLSPRNLSPAKMAELADDHDEDIKLPPCELNRFRPLAFNTSIACVNALFAFWGFDSQRFFQEAMGTQGDNVPVGLMTTWIASHNHYAPIMEMTAISEPGAGG